MALSEFILLVTEVAVRLTWSAISLYEILEFFSNMDMIRRSMRSILSVETVINSLIGYTTIGIEEI